MRFNYLLALAALTIPLIGIETAQARFLQTDPIGYGGGYNIYAYTANDPVNWVDYNGQAPNKPGATDSRAVQATIRNGGLAALAGNGGNTQRYFYTKSYGWVDVRHFGTAATDVINGTPGVVEEVLGFGNEVVQWATEWGNDYRSGFSPEDLPSNSAGISFGQIVADNPNTPVEDLFKQWSTENGAVASTSQEYKDAYAALPATDPSDRGGAGRGSSNPSSSPQGGPPNDNGSGSNQSNGNRGCNSGVVSNRRC